jgi:hypothetical protein
MREEVGEFIEAVDDLDDSPETQRVRDHLKQTKAVVALQLFADLDDDGYRAARTFLTYFVERCGGLVYADGEGFYEGDELIVGLE